MHRIYLDNNSTTALDPKVLQAMLIDLNGPPANPSSVHYFGQRAKKLLTDARKVGASYFKVKPEEIYFTSGATESLNLILRGLSPGHLITTDLEHSAIYQTALELQSKGRLVTFLSCPTGAPTHEQVEQAIRPDTRALLFSACNSETGVKLDFDAIGAIAKSHNIPLFIDAVAWIGKEEFPLHPAITGLALSAHKFHGPKGIGLLYLRSSTKLSPLSTGGGQEFKLRAGTENLAAILGLAEALTILSESQPEITAHLTSLKKRFESELSRHIPNLLIHGEGPRICSTSNIAFPGVDGETLLLQLDLAGVSASHGSACSSGALEPSRILTNMGIERRIARSSLRFSFSRQNTLEEIDKAIAIIVSLVTKLKELK